MTLPVEAVQALTALLGDRLSTSQADRDHHAGTEAHHAPAPPDAVVWPLSNQEVAETVRICRAHGLPVIGHGAGSSLEGNTCATRGGVCVDLSRMNAILAVRPDDLDCTVQAGVTREELNTFLRDTGLFFPIDPGANASLGGMAATRASGTNAVRYGTMRENTLSLTVVTPDGEIVKTARRARKSSAGYDLTNLFVGSEGTLGLITEVTLKLYGRPEAVRAAVCTFPDPASASRTAIEAIQIGLPIARVEYLDAGCIRAVNEYSALQEAEADTLFVEFHGSEAGVEEQVALFGEIAEGHGGSNFRWADREEDRNRLWKARHNGYPATVNQRAGARGWATDVCVPLSALPDCISHAKEILAGCPVPASIMGHVGDGNFHVVFAIDPNNSEELEMVAKVNSAMVAKALEHDGTCTGEHGVGIGKRKYMQAEHGPALALMRAIKTALDPAGLMNPDKILPPMEDAAQ